MRVEKDYYQTDEKPWGFDEEGDNRLYTNLSKEEALNKIKEIINEEIRENIEVTNTSYSNYHERFYVNLNTGDQFKWSNVKRYPMEADANYMQDRVLELVEEMNSYYKNNIHKIIEFFDSQLKDNMTTTIKVECDVFSTRFITVEKENKHSFSFALDRRPPLHSEFEGIVIYEF